jgi:hypothetical protein
MQCHLFLAERLDRIEARGAVSGIDAERDAHDDAEREPEED